MPTPRILAFAGSAREDSFNKKLVRLAAAAAQQAGADVTLIDLRDFPLPLMDQDLEARDGVPENARKLRQLFVEHQGLLIASPEYNSSITPLLKNVIDWVSRPEQGHPGLEAYVSKTAAIISASPGALGGMRALVHLRSILGNINVLVIPETMSIGKAHEAFNADGTLKDAKQQDSLTNVAKKLVTILQKLGA